MVSGGHGGCSGFLTGDNKGVDGAPHCSDPPLYGHSPQNMRFFGMAFLNCFRFRSSLTGWWLTLFGLGFLSPFFFPLFYLAQIAVLAVVLALVEITANLS